VGTATTVKTGQRGDHGLGSEKAVTTIKAKAKPANEVITGFGVDLSASDRNNPESIPSSSICEPFREAVEIGLSRGRNAMAIWQDLGVGEWVQRRLSDGQTLRT
jgi:hypothetical protein